MNLNSQQKEFVYSTGRRILCLAGAGTGKTQSLISKICYTIDVFKEDPSRILALTFTHAAGLEMKARFVKETQNSTTPEFCTFHSFCYKVFVESEDIRKFFGYTDIPRVLDERQAGELADRARLMTGVKLPKAANSIYYKPTHKEDFEYRVLHQCMTKFQIADNQITFDKLCDDICTLFETKSELVKPYLNKYHYVYVDEFQDTDKVQWRFVQSFLDYASVILIGDPNQSLYQFRGADSSIIKSIARDKTWDVYKLEQNYRSTKPICDFANGIIEKYSDFDESPKLKSELIGPGIGVTKVSEFFDTSHLTLFKDMRWSCAILCRTNSDVKYVSSKLSQYGIDHRSKMSNRLNELVAAALDQNYKKSLLLNSLPKSSQLEVLRQELINRDSDILKTLTLRCAELNSEIEACKNLENYDELERLYLTSQITLSDILESNNFKDSNLYVGTIHSVKGLEFDAVFVYNVNSDSFKLGTSEEITNIFYVACTRAKTNLIIVFSENR